MRFSDERYRRHIEQHELALRILAHEVRNGTICAWTGLSPHRVRALYTSYVAGGETTVARHRGKSPSQLAFLLRSLRLRSEAAVLGGLLRLFGALPRNGALLPSLAVGMKLCEAYETYAELVAAPRLSLEQGVLLCTALSSEDEIRLATRPSCGGAMIEDRMELKKRECGYCDNGVNDIRQPVAALFGQLFSNTRSGLSG